MGAVAGVNSNFGYAVGVLQEGKKAGEAIPKLVKNSTFDKASAPDLQEARPVSKQLMCQHMGDADTCKDGDAGAVKSEVVNQLRYKHARRKARADFIWQQVNKDYKNFR